MPETNNEAKTLISVSASLGFAAFGHFAQFSYILYTRQIIE